MLTPINGGRSGEATYRNWPVIPAHPGFELLMALMVEGGRIEVARLPVIGWRIPPDEDAGVPRPIVLDGYNIDGDEALRYPDGSVDDGELVYPNEEAWLKEQRKRLKAMA